MLAYQLFLLCLSFLLGLFLYILITRKNNYWKNKNVPHLKPSFLFGNYKDYIMLNKHIGQVAGEICEQFPDAPYIGTYFGTEPALLLSDPEVIKIVLTKNFNTFNGRDISDYADREFVTNCMFFIAGDSWKFTRQYLTPLFSTAKMKNMFHLIKHCSNTFEKFLLVEVRSSAVIETKTLMSRYTMDCICSCAFGINSEVMDKTNLNNPFLKLGQELFSQQRWRGFKLVFRSMWPYVFYKCGFKLFPNELRHFFSKILNDVMKSRENMVSSRQDFVDLLMAWKKSEYLSGMNSITGTPLTKSVEVADDLILSQCIQLFGGSFETSSSVLALVLFELAKNETAQAKVIDEVDLHLTNYSGKLEYEYFMEMPYLDACFQETMRLYPAIGVLTRETMADYTFSTGLRVEKGVRIHIPLFYLHRNPKYFPEPELFRPERFLGDEKLKIIPYTYMPFGEGPRICIGTRFAKIQMTAAIVAIFKHFRTELANDMPRTLGILPGCLNTQADCGIYVRFVPRSG